MEAEILYFSDEDEEQSLWLLSLGKQEVKSWFDEKGLDERWGVVPF